MTGFVLAGLVLAAVAVVVILALRDYQHLRHEFSRSTSVTERLVPRPFLAGFTVADPYAGPGAYRKAQLHVHTSNSPDVREKVPVAETVRRYREAGCSFVALTDHDRVTSVEGLSTPEVTVIPGEEKTLPLLVWPLGRHMLRLGIGLGGPELRAPAHPSWMGNLGTGRWHLEDLLDRSDLVLFEIFNGRSNSSFDFWLWHQLLNQRGWRSPVWGIAVDDTDNAKAIDAGWVMVKTEGLAAEELLSALRAGRFYATTGPEAHFGLDGGVIRAESPDAAWIRFLDARGEAVAVFRGGAGEYRPAGDEGFIRVEVVAQDDHAAWSQPFFLIPQEAGAPAARG